ncbi:MAG: CDP-diacylglycerol--glycerol-3-phosphate 3-phosphatidyltransferase [Thermoguttaceae bacterium]
MIWNAPNILTMLRVVFSVGIFIVLPFNCFIAATVLFILAAITDFLDGYLARKYNLITVFGRIMDPFADKLLICGCFVYLVAFQQLLEVPFGLRPWMSVVIVARELLITSLRAVIEKSGGDFSAKWIGKWKMVLQCIAVPACFMYLICSICPFIKYTMIISLWGTVLITIYSGIAYVFAATRMIGKNNAV